MTVQFSNTPSTRRAGRDDDAGGPYRCPLSGLGNIGGAGGCNAVLSGHLGSAEQGDEILAVGGGQGGQSGGHLTSAIPSWGTRRRGCIVAPGVTRFLMEKALPVADIMAPNLLELETLCGLHLATPAQTPGPRLISCRKAASRWCWSSHLGRCRQRGRALRDAAGDPRGDYLIARPLYDLPVSR